MILPKDIIFVYYPDEEYISYKTGVLTEPIEVTPVYSIPNGENVRFMNSFLVMVNQYTLGGHGQFNRNKYITFMYNDGEKEVVLYVPVYVNQSGIAIPYTEQDYYLKNK